MTDGPTPPLVSWPPVPPMRAGLRCRCPRCGRGALFSGLLTVAEHCAVCGLDLTPHDSGDGPAVFVIFLLAPIIVPLGVWIEFTFGPPIWLNLIVWPPLVIVLSIMLLRPMKAILVAYHFRNLRHRYDE